jgi:DNA polymerase I
MRPPLISDWRALPHEEIWVWDSEFYPGPGLANGGRDGDAPTPLCLVAIEMRSGRVVRQWQDGFSESAPFRIDGGSLVVSFFSTAEFGVQIALGWPQPANTLDAYVEFRHHTNDGAVKSEDRDKGDKDEKRGKGFYGLAGALLYFHEDPINTTHKKEMRDRILQGPPFSADEREQILEYCEDDVCALMRLVKHIVPTVRSWPHALARCNYTWALAHQERRGVPLDLARLNPARARWHEIQLDLVIERDRFGLFEIVDGKPHWRRHRFKELVRRNGWAWLTHDDGTLDESQQAFRDMAGRYPEVETLRDLKYSLSKLRLSDLAVGSDGRNRCLLGAYGTKTARNAPSTTKFCFGPAKWLRFMIAPTLGRVLVHRDYMQQEMRIAALLSGDDALLAACEVDVYLGIAEQLGFLRESMSPSERRAVRVMFKTVVLGVTYGLGARSLALRTGLGLGESYELLARLRARFHKFEAYAECCVDHAGMNLEISTPFGWTMRCPSGINPRTVRNFPIQSTASEVLHVACVLAERRGIQIVAPVHDALMAEGPADQAEELSVALDQVMRDASAVVLRGYELPTDSQIIRSGEHFFDDRGLEMWTTVERLLKKLEGKRHEGR